MREIKFRCWDKKEKIMSEVDGITNLNHNDDDQFKYVCCHAVVQWNDMELMQYTGLKDKNGKNIYEGDIVKWRDGDYNHESNPRIAVVEFSPELAFYAINCTTYDYTGRYGAKNGYGKKFGFSNFIYTDTENHFDIIGNIYEHPELIKNLQS